VSAAQAGVGALATQSWVNVAYKPDGLALLRAGRSAAECVEALTSADEGRATRQLGVVDALGGSATFTGAQCSDWAGGRSGPGYAVQGNILTGPEVVEAMERAWLSSDVHAPLAHRLVAALVAGDDAGGDSRGRQSAGVLVVGLTACADNGVEPVSGAGADLECDLRVDDHPQATTELVRLLALHDLYFGKADPATLLPLEGDLAAEVAVRIERLGYPDLDEWAGMENYEARLVPGLIDPVVLEKLRAADSAQGGPPPTTVH
jgi:uncharacterized Ntn-hydrolase superfamily protein